MRNTGLSIHWARPKWGFGFEGVSVLLNENQVAFLGASGSLILAHPPGDYVAKFVLRGVKDRVSDDYRLNIPPGGIRQVELDYSRLRGRLNVWINPTA